jgi:hypothetical protein
MSKTKTTTKAPRLRAERALCIGINEAQGAPPLAGCVNDARDFAKALAGRGFEVTTLFDSQATKKNILDGLARLVDVTRSGETAVSTISCHGTTVPDYNGDEPDGRDEALCPYDLMDGVILDDELHEIFSAARYGARIVLISDSCHSGSVMRFANLEQADTRAKIRYLPPEVFLSKRELKDAKAVENTPLRGVIRPPEGVLISGCADPEYSYDAWFNRRANGAFTYVALKALERLPPKGTYKDWHGIIRGALPSIQFPQTPQIDGSYHHQRWPVFQSLTG